jgi:hypothetical protein
MSVIHQNSSLLTFNRQVFARHNRKEESIDV